MDTDRPEKGYQHRGESIMKIEVAKDTFGFIVRLSGAGTDFQSALDSFKNWIPASCRHYIGERKQWRVELRSEDYLRFWLAEMNAERATIIDTNAQQQARVTSDGSGATARLLLRRAHQDLYLRPDAPVILAEAAYTVLKSQTTDEQARALLDCAIATIRAKGQVEDAA